MEAVLTKANEHGLRIFLYGGTTPKVLEDLKSYIKCNFPKVLIVGSYREDNFGQQTIDMALLQASKPHLVFIGLGCPAQEIWIENNKTKVNAVMMGVGAAFSFYSGATQMAPFWMQDHGLEWAYRLYKEPLRLWRRYFYYNSYFVVLVIRKILGFPDHLKPG